MEVGNTQDLMAAPDLIQLVLVLLLIVFGMYFVAYLVRKYVPGFSEMSGQSSIFQKNKRLKLIQSIPLDPKNRVVVLHDHEENREYTLAIGPQSIVELQGRHLDAPSQKKNNAKKAKK